MRKIEPELITGMGYIGDNPGVLYRMGGAGEQTVVTGNPALLEGVKGSRITALTLHGKSSQGSTTGAQLFDIGNEFVSQEKNGVTFTVENNEIVINGTATSSVDLFSKKVFWEKLTPGEYTFTIQNSPDVRLILNMDSKVYQTSEGAMTVKIMPESTISYLVIRISQNSTFKNYKLKIMLNSGPTALPWEPYTGGAPSPSPSYPQEIESNGDDGKISVDVQGANLFDINDNSTIIDGCFVDSNRKLVIANGNYGRVFKLLPNTSYTWTQEQRLENAQSQKTDIQIALFDEIPTQGKIAKVRHGNSDSKVVFKFNTDEKYVYLFVKTGHSTVNKNRYENEKSAILNIGTEPLPYEPYKPAQTLIIPTPGGLPGIPVSSGGNYTDEKGQQWVADEIDLAMGERVQWIGKHELTGKENVADFGLSPRTRMVSIAIPDAYIDAGNHGYLKAVMSNKYKQAKCSELKDDINLIARGQQRNICFSIPTDVGIEDFKTDLSNQYASGRPVKVYYKLATPIRTPLPPETIAAYKALHTYSPTTTVINDAGAGMSVGYKKVRLRKCMM